ncbi:MAG: hypothetical protein RLZ23_327 [Actinomycetota bacterium]
MTSDTGNAAEDRKGRKVEIGAFALPGRYEAVYFISIILHTRIILHVIGVYWSPALPKIRENIGSAIV